MRRSRFIIAISLSLICGVAIAGAVAFLTARTETKTNVFTVGEVSIELKEPQWSAQPDNNKNGIPDKAENLSPSETVVKDPKVTNVGINDAYIYLRVRVPKETVDYADENGNVVKKGTIELFSYEENPGWSEFLKDSTDEYTDYYYYYDNVVAPTDTTLELFNTITFADVIEGQLEDKNYTVDITAYGVQVTEDTDAISAWNQLAAEKHLLKYEGEMT